MFHLVTGIDDKRRRKLKSNRNFVGGGGVQHNEGQACRLRGSSSLLPMCSLRAEHLLQYFPLKQEWRTNSCSRGSYSSPAEKNREWLGLVDNDSLGQSCNTDH
jgi:hypothetical protein